MSLKKFEPHCPGCRLVILDIESGQPLPDDHPLIQQLYAAYAQLTREEKESIHAIMVRNSRNPDDLKALAKLRALLVPDPKLEKL